MNFLSNFDSMAKKRILFFDTIIDGHHPHYFRYIIEYFKEKDSYEIYLASNQDLKGYLSHYYPTGLPTNFIHFIAIQSKQIDQFHSKNILFRSLSEWNYFVRMGEDLQIDVGVLPYFDTYQFGAMIGNKPKFQVSGILFRAIHPLNPLSFYDHLKVSMVKRIFSKPYINRLYFLDESVADSYQAISKSSFSICDPINFNNPDYIENLNCFELPKKNHKIRFGLVGQIDNRKGIEFFIQACKNLNKEELNQIQLVIMGLTKKDYQVQLTKLFKSVPDLEIYTQYEWLEDECLEFGLYHSDIVLALYKNHLGSSSILVKAAYYQKPVLGSNQGLIGKNIQFYHLGLTVNPADLEELKGAIQQIIRGDFPINKEGMRKFAQKNSIQEFGKTLENGF